MSRRVPEFALVTGGFLALSLLFAGLLFTDDATLTVLLAGTVGYPLAAYAVVHAEDPTDVLPPTAVLVAGLVVGVAAAAVVGVTARVPLPARAFFALFAGLAFALPGLAYRVRYGPETGPAPAPVAAGSLAVGGTLLLAGLFARAPLYAAAAGLLVGLAGGLFAYARGYRPTHRTRQRSLVAGAGFGGVLVAVGLATGVPLSQGVTVAVAATLGPAVYHALTSDAAA